MASTADTVAGGLRSEATRTATLDALEALAEPIPSAVALAAAPALVDAMIMETERASFDRSGLLLARLCAEAAPESATAVYGAALGGGERFAASFAPALVVGAVRRASSAAGQPLTREDARSYACFWAQEDRAHVRGLTAPYAVAGYSVVEYLAIVSFITTLLLILPVLTLVALSARSE